MIIALARFLIYSVLFTGVLLIVFGILWYSKYPKVGLKIPKEEIEKLKKARLRELLATVFPFSQKILERFKLYQKLEHRLDAAHVKLSPPEFFNIKILLTVIIGLWIFVVLEKPDLMTMAIVLFFIFILPDIWLMRKVSQRKNTIARMLPETVDLLGLCIEAGLDFTTSMEWVIEKVPNNPLIEEFAFVLEEIKWGKPRSQALRDMSKRLSIPEVSSFVQTLVQAERLGTSVAEAFSILSEDTRNQRFRLGERYAMKAPIKILLPLIFCILPVIGIIIGGPILLQFTQGTSLSGLGGF